MCILNNIINQLHAKIKNINSIYQYPNDPNFHLLKIPAMDWPTAKDGNFFNIIRVLAIRGAISLTALSNLHTDGNHPYDSVFQIFYRLLNGSVNGSNISLQQRGLIIKRGRLYELSPFGVLYAIHVFHMDKYYDKKHQPTKTSNFSYQKGIDGIFDIIKKHYDYFPLFFDNLDYIKSSKELDVNVFFDMINPNSIFCNNSLYNFHTFAASDFSSQLEELIPFIFYYSSAMNNVSYTKKPFKFMNPISGKLEEISDNMLEKMKGDVKLYNEINSKLF